ncbi:calcium-dependent phosphotriesterase [Teratosphaeria nubilosa]|uniref:Calcium-dependent phosphotriesterase n=1 Tax=Teratosphaeria nubilosa TaxID=161662 RepID=A0A6G1KYH7_9PEZI|nr:calcium-dependent phosphotriesterase [Teratosphaeria nubilosa]
MHLSLLAILFPSVLIPTHVTATQENPFLSPLPTGFENTTNTVLLKDNLAVIPAEWEHASLLSVFHDLRSDDSAVNSAFKAISRASFIAWDASFLSLTGPDAKVEALQSFEPPENTHTHEAPVYLPETNEVLYSDTSLVGTLFAIGVDGREIREIKTTPPLRNVNGGTYHDGAVYVVENGGSVRGLWKLNSSTGEAECLLNNYRGRHLNSPNDLIFNSKGDIYFTDPAYGWHQRWPGVQPPQLPNAIYHFNAQTKALTPLTNTLPTPNGLALSPDERTLYIANSNSSLGSPSSTRDVYAFDVSASGTQLTNQRLVYQAAEGFPDGIRVSKGGYLFVASAGGVNVVDPRTGVVMGRVNTPGDVVFNLEAVGMGGWVLTGNKHIYKVTMVESGKGQGGDGKAVVEGAEGLVGKVRGWLMGRLVEGVGERKEL